MIPVTNSSRWRKQNQNKHHSPLSLIPVTNSSPVSLTLMTIPHRCQRYQWYIPKVANISISFRKNLKRQKPFSQSQERTWSIKKNCCQKSRVTVLLNNSSKESKRHSAQIWTTDKTRKTSLVLAPLLRCERHGYAVLFDTSKGGQGQCTENLGRVRQSL